jgi:hypothetical protein
MKEAKRGMRHAGMLCAVVVAALLTFVGAAGDNSTQAPATMAAPTPAPPMATVVQGVTTDDEIYVTVSDARAAPTADNRDALEAAATTVLNAVYLTVIAPPGEAPTAMTIAVKAQPTENAGVWLLTVSVIREGGSLSAAELSALLTQRLSDAINADQTKPAPLAAAGMQSASGQRELMVDPLLLRLLKDRLQEAQFSEPTGWPAWLLFIGVLTLALVGGGVGAILARSCARLQPAKLPPLRERLLNHPTLQGED